MNPKIDKAFISFRIGISQWMPENRFRELLDLFEEYRGVTDEITFFTSETHPPLPLEEVEARAAILAKRMEHVRKLGYKTGINILATIGHHNENLPHSLSEDYTRMTDIDGNVCLGSFCPNDERMVGYIKQLYEIIVAANPDYIWLDDDIRLFGHMPITATCFCDNCLRIFADECGVSYTRESLKAAFNKGAVEEKLEVRRAWLQHNRNTIARLFKLIEKTVHDLKPGMSLGFMTGDRFFEGYDFDKWAKILAGPDNAEVLWRPGGGFYKDDCLKDLIGKSHDVGRQVSMLPDSVVSIQSEIENFPYQLMKKAAHTTALEAASHIASGCTGTAFNVLSDDPVDEYKPLVAKLRQMRPFYDFLARELGRAKPQGLYTDWNKDVFVANNITAGDWFSGDIWSLGGEWANEILEIGIPAAYSPAYASVTVLSGDGVLALNEDEISQTLSSGVYSDALALTHLNKLGYGELTGFEVARFVEEDCIEQLTDDPLNSSFASRKRNGRQSFYKSSAGMLKPLSTSARILARAVDYSGSEIAPCCMGVFENQLGGRICVAGYYPWVFLQNLSKSSQVKAVLRWLSRDTLPAYIASFHKINMWVRETEKDKMALTVTNSYLDTAEDVTLMLLTDKDEISVFDMNCAETKVQSSDTDGVYKQFTLPPIEPWHMRVLVV